MKVKAVTFTALAAASLAVLPTVAHAACAPTAEQAAATARVVDGELARLAQWKPGSDERDAAWLKANLTDLVPDWLPRTRAMAAKAEPDIEELVDECHRPGDYSSATPERNAFLDCAKQVAKEQVVPQHVAEWGALCGEVRDALADPATPEKVRAWTRQWVDTYVEHVRNRPAG